MVYSYVSLTRLARTHHRRSTNWLAEEAWLYGRVNEGEGEFQPRVPIIKFSVRNCGRPGSESNTGAGEIQIKKACQKSWQIGPKNEDIAESVSSIDSGAIFPARLVQDISRNVPAMSVYALYKKLYCRGKRNRDHLCDRLASEQFSYLDQMISYPEIYSPCVSMRLINILIEGTIFFVTSESRDFREIWIFLEN